MKKEEYKYQFIKLRALGFTYDKICKQLNISKPTAIKWSKIFSFDINKQQKYLLANLFSQRIVEKEQGLLIKLEQFRRRKGMNLPQKIRDRIDKKIMKSLESTFKKKITAIHLTIKNEDITSATFIFNDDVIVKDKNKADDKTYGV